VADLSTRLKDAICGIGGRLERTRPEQVLKLGIPMPDIEMQWKAASLLQRMEVTKRLRSHSERELMALIPSVLDRAFRGEL